MLRCSAVDRTFITGYGQRSGVLKKEAFQEKIRQLGALVGELDVLPGNSGQGTARELVQLLLEIHSSGLERIMEIIDESGEPGEGIILRVGQDPIVRHLLLLHSLHPEDLEIRVLKAINLAGPRLRKHNSELELLSIQDGAVQVRVRTSGHVCGSTGKTVQSIVEESMYDLAPDLASLEILPQEDAASSGFVSLDTLQKHPSSANAMAMQGAKLCGAD
jgi:Fe-S cluster biogenesis protein NfuA